jgi:hypothetical protein
VVLRSPGAGVELCRSSTLRLTRRWEGTRNPRKQEVGKLRQSIVIISLLILNGTLVTASSGSPIDRTGAVHISGLVERAAGALSSSFPEIAP